ncbi:hypothetical protein [Streptomyces sp. ME19-01-6]|uniref:hypothetical protein n=1 Tax=Streptomyces sp. ME19-01-6 TaxID=3028686 RepID=UPI0029AD2CA0|nr:hypothetical protein [Streptomyces sp. ME19-01-6]MDX3230580.1 hypothetical protein [Streptomyces sp. ME19-01-6]
MPDQVVNLAAFWGSLSHDAELKATLAQPAPYEARWVIPVALGAVAVLCLTTGGAAAILLGIVLLLATAGAGVWIHRESAEREAARAAWLRLLYCRHCPNQFPPDKALIS